MRTVLTSLRRSAALALTACAAAAVLAACGGSDGGGQAPPPAAAAPQAGSGGGGGAPAPAGQTTEVQMTEFTLTLPTSTFSPGMHTFNAVNSGKIVHAISLDGPGIEDQKTMNVQPGQSATLTVNLQPGTYDLYCPVGMHKQRGMDTKLTVQ